MYPAKPTPFFQGLAEQGAWHGATWAKEQLKLSHHTVGNENIIVSTLERLFGLDLPDGLGAVLPPGGCETLPGSTATKGHTVLESAGGTTLSPLRST